MKIFNIVAAIHDSRLTADMQRVRNGSKQEFYILKEGVKMSHGLVAEIVAPEKHLYAEKIDDEWFWVNGCAVCSGKERGGSYIECEKHDVCRTCSKPRALVEGAWGGHNGWQCGECHDREYDEGAREALARAKKAGHSLSDCRGTSKIVCPYCATEHDGEYESTPKMECETCGGEFGVEADFTIDYTTAPVKAPEGYEPPKVCHEQK